MEDAFIAIVEAARQRQPNQAAHQQHAAGKGGAT
jgi:hypothetical protein